MSIFTIEREREREREAKDGALNNGLKIMKPNNNNNPFRICMYKQS